MRTLRQTVEYRCLVLRSRVSGLQFRSRTRFSRYTTVNGMLQIRSLNQSLNLPIFILDIVLLFYFLNSNIKFG